MEHNLEQFKILCSPLVFAVALAGCQSQGEREPKPGKRLDPVVYGTDNRVDYPNISDPRLKTMADSVAGLFVGDMVACSGSNCTLGPLHQTTSEVTEASYPNERPMCSSVPFQNQFGGAWCTAVLVGPDTFATAGHCLEETTCNVNGAGAFRVVFGFYADSSGNSPDNKVVAATNVYSCAGTPTKVHAAGEDWAIFKVERVVTDRNPLIAQYSGSLQASNEHVVIGYPESLPQKTARDAWVKVDDPNDPKAFEASGDIFPGNSGGPLIDVETGVVVGVLSYGGGWHYVDQGTTPCAAVNVCDMTTGCPGANGWNGYTRMSWAANQGQLPLHPALNAMAIF